jgi:hypothetical protein
MYEHLERDLNGPNNKMIWKAKIPLKIQIFMWQVFRNAIPTRDNMRKRKWPGTPVCSFCKQVESVEHLFFSCPIARVAWATLGKFLGTSRCPGSLWQAICWFYKFLPGGEGMYMVGLAAMCWSIWTLRNKVTFDGHIVRNPMEPIFIMCAFVLYWAGLQADGIRGQVVQRTGELMKMAAEMTKKTKMDAGGSQVRIGD